MQPHLNANTPLLCSLVLVRMARDHLFVFVDKLWLGSTEVSPPSFSCSFYKLMRLYYDKGARENEEDKHVKEDEVKHKFRATERGSSVI